MNEQGDRELTEVDELTVKRRRPGMKLFTQAILHDYPQLPTSHSRGPGHTNVYTLRQYIKVHAV